MEITVLGTIYYVKQNRYNTLNLISIECESGIISQLI